MPKSTFGHPSLTPEAVPPTDGTFMAAQSDVKTVLSFICYIDICLYLSENMFPTMKSFILCMNGTVRGTDGGFATLAYPVPNALCYKRVNKLI